MSFPPFSGDGTMVVATPRSNKWIDNGFDKEDIIAKKKKVAAALHADQTKLTRCELEMRGSPDFKVSKWDPILEAVSRIFDVDVDEWDKVSKRIRNRILHATVRPSLRRNENERDSLNEAIAILTAREEAALNNENSQCDPFLQIKYE